jgi:hypothetical protein
MESILVKLLFSRKLLSHCIRHFDCKAPWQILSGVQFEPTNRKTGLEFDCILQNIFNKWPIERQARPLKIFKHLKVLFKADPIHTVPLSVHCNLATQSHGTTVRTCNISTQSYSTTVRTCHLATQSYCTTARTL